MKAFTIFFLVLFLIIWAIMTVVMTLLFVPFILLEQTDHTKDWFEIPARIFNLAGKVFEAEQL